MPQFKGIRREKYGHSSEVLLHLASRMEVWYRSEVDTYCCGWYLLWSMWLWLVHIVVDMVLWLVTIVVDVVDTYSLERWERRSELLEKTEEIFSLSFEQIRKSSS